MGAHSPTQFSTCREAGHYSKWQSSKPECSNPENYQQNDNGGSSRSTWHLGRLARFTVVASSSLFNTWRMDRFENFHHRDQPRRHFYSYRQSCLLVIVRAISQVNDSAVEVPPISMDGRNFQNSPLAKCRTRTATCSYNRGAREYTTSISSSLRCSLLVVF